MGRNDQGIKMEWRVGKQCSNTEGAVEKLRTKVENTPPSQPISCHSHGQYFRPDNKGKQAMSPPPRSLQLKTVMSVPSDMWKTVQRVSDALSQEMHQGEMNL